MSDKRTSSQTFDAMMAAADRATQKKLALTSPSEMIAAMLVDAAGLVAAMREECELADSLAFPKTSAENAREIAESVRDVCRRNADGVCEKIIPAIRGKLEAVDKSHHAGVLASIGQLHRVANATLDAVELWHVSVSSIGRWFILQDRVPTFDPAPIHAVADGIRFAPAPPPTADAGRGETKKSDRIRAALEDIDRDPNTREIAGKCGQWTDGAQLSAWEKVYGIAALVASIQDKLKENPAVTHEQVRRVVLPAADNSTTPNLSKINKAIRGGLK